MYVYATAQDSRATGQQRATSDTGREGEWEAEVSDIVRDGEVLEEEAAVDSAVHCEAEVLAGRLLHDPECVTASLDRAELRKRVTHLQLARDRDGGMECKVVGGVACGLGRAAADAWAASKAQRQRQLPQREEE